MKQSPSISHIGSIVSKIFSRYHVIIFSLTVVIGVSVAIFFLNGLISLSKESEPLNVTTTTFDEETIEKIENFSPSSEAKSNFSLPPGRTNPFVE